MTDRIFLHLCEDWALGADELQWIVMRRKKRGDQRYWNPEAFIATEKRILRRVLREKGIEPTPEAARYLSSMPDTFKEWHHLRTAYKVAAE